MRKDGIEDERCLVGEVLKVLREVTIEDGEEADGSFSNGTKWAKCSVPIASDASFPLSLISLVSNFMATPCMRDLMVMYVSSGHWAMSPLKPAARAHSLIS